VAGEWAEFGENHRRLAGHFLHHAGEGIGFADEACDEFGLWVVVDGAAVADLLDVAAVHHGDAV
jgi:hypothetical protein